jgi:hypothetical protein
MQDLSLLELDSGIVYRNLLPHVMSKHAYFPSVVYLNNGEILTSLVLGEAFEAVNLDTYVVRSNDMGRNWSKPKPVLSEGAKHLTSNCGRLTVLTDGKLVSMVVRSHRESHPDSGLANPDNLGFVPTDLLLTRSFDYGHTWSAPEKILPPIDGPSFEACSPIVLLKDGRWIWPTSTWRGWDGYCPNGMKMIALVSYDKGKTWPDYMDIMNGSPDNIIYWEGKVAELNNGTLIAVSWAFNEMEGKDLTNHYVYSTDGGKTWSVPLSTGIQGQTMSITGLRDNLLLIVYRRMDEPGLWLGVTEFKEGKWVNKGSFCLWGKESVNLIDKSGQIVQDFNQLKFGAPDIISLPDGSFFVVFWCYEDMVSNIRWFKFSVQ